MVLTLPTSMERNLFHNWVIIQDQHYLKQNPLLNQILDHSKAFNRPLVVNQVKDILMPPMHLANSLTEVHQPVCHILIRDLPQLKVTLLLITQSIVIGLLIIQVHLWEAKNLNRKINLSHIWKISSKHSKICTPLLI